MLIIRKKQLVALFFFYLPEHLKVDYLTPYAVKRTFLAIIAFERVAHAIIPNQTLVDGIARSLVAAFLFHGITLRPAVGQQQFEVSATGCLLVVLFQIQVGLPVLLYKGQKPAVRFSGHYVADIHLQLTESFRAVENKVCHRGMVFSSGRRGDFRQYFLGTSHQHPTHANAQ